MTSHRELIRKLIHTAGGFLSAAALLWMGWRISRLLSDDVVAAARGMDIALLVPAMAAACASAAGLAVGWVSMLELLEGRPLPRTALATLYLRTQAGKYLPGNVFHYVLRHTMGRGLGLTHGSLVYSAFWEAAVLAGLALLISSPLLASLMNEFAPGRAPWLVASVLAAVAAAGGILVWRRRGNMPTARLAGAPALRLIGGYLVFFAAGSAALWLSFSEMRGAWPHTLLLVSGAWASAWLLGFITPGSPGGIGVRESVLVAVLSTAVGEPRALIVAILFRMLTIAADAALWALTYFGPLARTLRPLAVGEALRYPSGAEPLPDAARAESPQSGAG